MSSPVAYVASIEQALQERVPAGVTMVCVLIDPSTERPNVITNATGVPKHVAEILQRVVDCWWRAAADMETDAASPEKKGGGAA